MSDFERIFVCDKERNGTDRMIRVSNIGQERFDIVDVNGGLSDMQIRAEVVCLLHRGRSVLALSDRTLPTSVVTKRDEQIAVDANPDSIFKTATRRMLFERGVYTRDENLKLIGFVELGDVRSYVYRCDVFDIDGVLDMEVYTPEALLDGNADVLVNRIASEVF